MIGAFSLTTVEAGVINGFLGTPPIGIEVCAEPIAEFDKHDPLRQRFGQLEYRSGLTLTSSYREFGGLFAIRLAPRGAPFRPQTLPTNLGLEALAFVPRNQPMGGTLIAINVASTKPEIYAPF